MRFLENKAYYIELAYRALSARFTDRVAFDNFFESISSDVEKDTFLRVTTYYLLLVKAGNWVVDDPASNPVVDYLTNSYKLITLLSLIESLGDGEFIDFYESLVARDDGAPFPLTREALDRRYAVYKARFGSFRRCVAFFEGLPEQEKARLTGAFTHAQETLSVKEVVRFLYELRSKFVHEGRLILHLSEGPVLLFRNGKKPLLVQLSMNQVCEVFELGLIAHFTGATRLA